VNRQWIVAVHQHVPTPLTHAYDKHLDLEIGGRFPLTEHIKDSLLRILVLRRRTLWAFEPTDHILHQYSPLLCAHAALARISGDLVRT
jgi:hypothetical protein